MIEAMPGPSSTPALAVAAVARRLGVAPATLRTWDRRYGLGPSGRSAGSHRRYTAADVERLLVMRRLTVEGVAPVDAARAALSADDAALLDGSTPVAAERTPSALVDAALACDAARCRRLLALDGPDEGSGAPHDVTRWWTELVAPARQGLARRTVLARPGEDADAVLVAAALDALRSRLVRPHSAGAPVVLLLVEPGEARPLLLDVLGAALADGGLDARVVTGISTTDRLVDLVDMASPVAVVTISGGPEPGLSLVGGLARERTGVQQFVMVAGDRAARRLPVGAAVHRARSFTGLLHAIAAVAAGDGSG